MKSVISQNSEVWNKTKAIRGNQTRPSTTASSCFLLIYTTGTARGYSPTSNTNARRLEFQSHLHWEGNDLCLQSELRILGRKLIRCKILVLCSRRMKPESLRRRITSMFRCWWRGRTYFSAVFLITSSTISIWRSRWRVAFDMYLGALAMQRSSLFWALWMMSRFQFFATPHT